MARRRAGGFSGSAVAVATKPTAEQLLGGMPSGLPPMRIGTGVGHIYYYGRQILFKDLMMQAEPFWHQLNDSNWPAGSEADPYPPATSVTHVNGYPSQNPVGGGWWKTIMRKGLNGNYESGVYHVIHDGDCRIRVWGDNAGRGSAATFNNTGGTFTLTTPADAGLHLELDQIVTPPTRIAVVPAAYVASYVASPFHPTALSTMAHYKILRFMDQCGPFSELTNWSQRTTMAWQTQHRELNQGPIANPLYNTYGGWERRWNTDYGMAVEYMVDMCNALGADLWVCFPAKATDDYVLQMVTLIKGRLNAGLKCYYEYGNEDWNSNFPQMVWMAGQANTRAEVQVPWTNPELNHMVPGAARNEEQTVLAQIFQGWRGAQMMRIVDSVYGQAERHRYIKVFGMQAHNTWAASWGLRLNNAHRAFDQLTFSSYWSHQEGAPWGTNDLSIWLAYCIAKIGQDGIDYNEAYIRTLYPTLPQFGPSEADRWIQCRNLAQQYGLTISAYEGGQHLQGNTDPQRTEWFTIQADPQFYLVYVHMCRVWKRICGASAPLVHYFDCGQWGTAGSWGSRQVMSDVTSPKYLALKDVATGVVSV